MRRVVAGLAITLVLACACGNADKPDARVAPSESPPLSSSATTTAPSASASADAGAAETPADVAPSASDDPAAAQAAAKKDGKALVIVFCAKWVAACGETAHVLADTGIRKTLEERFVVARVDASSEDDPTTKERMKRYNVKGLPLMIVFDRKGKEVAREIGYVDAAHFAKLLERAK